MPKCLVWIRPDRKRLFLIRHPPSPFYSTMKLSRLEFFCSVWHCSMLHSSRLPRRRARWATSQKFRKTYLRAEAWQVARARRSSDQFCQCIRDMLDLWKNWIKFNVEIFSNIGIALSFNVQLLNTENIESKSMSMSVQTLILQRCAWNKDGW